MKTNYDELTNRIENLLGEFTTHKFDSPITLKEFEELLDIRIDEEQFEKERQGNEYGTEDVKIDIETDEDITLLLTLEVDENNMITHLVDVDEY